MDICNITWQIMERLTILFYGVKDYVNIEFKKERLYVICYRDESMSLNYVCTECKSMNLCKFI